MLRLAVLAFLALSVGSLTVFAVQLHWTPSDSPRYREARWRAMIATCAATCSAVLALAMMA